MFKLSSNFKYMAEHSEPKAVPKVFNKYHNNVPTDAVYIGRGSPFGNPFTIGTNGNRDEVCDKFEEYVKSNPELVERIKKELCGKNLVCFCKPKRCHGDTLIRIANTENE